MALVDLNLTECKMEKGNEKGNHFMCNLQGLIFLALWESSDPQKQISMADSGWNMCSVSSKVLG